MAVSFFPVGIVWLANPILSDLPGNRRSYTFNYFLDTALPSLARTLPHENDVTLAARRAR
jgi:hypothetical protein